MQNKDSRPHKFLKYSRMVCYALQSAWKVARWILNIPLWWIILPVFILGVGWLIWFLFFAQYDGKTTPVDNSHIDGPVDLNEQLDAFRAKWDIYGRFEAWPALLPLAEMSNLAYSSEEEAKSFFKRLGFDSIASIKSPFHSQCAYIAHGDNVMVIAFRGTDEKEDWLSNANIYPHRMAEGDLHSGFGNAYGTLQSQILQEVEKTSPKHIWVTGHSLGGAMALVCAYDLVVFQNRSINGVITFGQPRIGKKNLAAVLQKKLGDRYVRFVNESDRVPLMPLSFAHCGLFLRFIDGRVEKSSDYFKKLTTSVPKDNQSKDYEYVPIDKLPEISQKEFDEFMLMYKLKQPPPKSHSTGVPKAYGMLNSWEEDHSMERYLEKIRDAIEKATGR